MLVLNSEEVFESLPMSDAIVCMKRAMTALSGDQANIPLRTHIDVAAGTTLIMPGHVNDDQGESLVVKVVSIFNHNKKQHGLDNILGIVNVLDPQTGEPIAVLDGAAVTAIRTAATSGAASDALANPDASQLAIIGSGTQARSHFHAMCVVRPIQLARFFAPNRRKLEDLVSGLETDVEVQIVDSSVRATKDADIICTTTNSSVPVIDDEAVRPGCHINAIGSYKPEVVEIPGKTIVRSRVYVDHRATALAEAGDLIQPLRRGEMDESDLVGEIGELFVGKIEGRTKGSQITLFKSVGNTVEDVVAASAIVKNAARLGLGQEISLH